MDPREIDTMVAKWRDRITPRDPKTAGALLNDAHHMVMLEMMSRFAHIYDQAMQLEDVPEKTRKRVLSMVLLGDPSGLEQIAAQRMEHLYQDMLMRTPPRPIYFNPYSFPFHPDEPLDLTSMGRD